MDRLLDMGFRDDILQLVALLPKERQTHLFSATMSDEAKCLMNEIIDPDFVLVDCIADNDATTHTSKKIRQTHVVLPESRLVTGFAQIILELMRAPSHKILVFFPTTRQVDYFSRLFNVGFGRRVLDIYSKKNQSARAVTSEQFRDAKEAVMFTSDVSARGVHYPNVTQVVQVGAAIDRETYIHRLGRTGRAGKTGKGVLVLMEAEKTYLTRDLSDLDIPINERLTELLTRRLSIDLEKDMMRIQHDMRNGDTLGMVKKATELYRSIFGYYSSRLGALGIESKGPLVDMVNAFAAQTGLRELPSITEKFANQVGVMGHPSLRILSQWSAGRGFDVGRSRSRRTLHPTFR
jgi:ATP-dependent RNA helicase MSS116, mitochondrial